MALREDIVGRHKSEIETPALMLDMSVLEANVAKMAGFFSGRPCKLRPHVKTHKLPMIARMQIEAGAIGLTCATLAEAASFQDAGFNSILIANLITDPLKLRHLAQLASRGDIIVCVDDFRNAADISQAAAECGSRPGILVEVNVGLNRCGVAPGKPALELATRIMRLKHVRFRGLMGYEGSFLDCLPDERNRRCSEANRLLTETKQLLEKNGLSVGIVTGGGTHTYTITGTCPGITDVQVGSYATMDGRNKAHGVEFGLATSVLTTVISRPEPTRAIADAGMKALSTDAGMPTPVKEGLSLFKLNEEHAYIRIENPDIDIKVNDKLEIIPSHGSTTIPLFDRYHAIRDDRVEAVLTFKPGY